MKLFNQNFFIKICKNFWLLLILIIIIKNTNLMQWSNVDAKNFTKKTSQLLFLPSYQTSPICFIVLWCGVFFTTWSVFASCLYKLSLLIVYILLENHIRIPSQWSYVAYQWGTVVSTAFLEKGVLKRKIRKLLYWVCWKFNINNTWEV